MPKQQIPPIHDAYWVKPYQLLAGRYPSAWEADLPLKLRQLLRAKVTFYINLTEEGEYEMPAYHQRLQQEAEKIGFIVEHHRIAVKDFDVPTHAQMKQILDLIDQAITAGHTVYVHCYGGIGRTGTVVGCHLVRHGFSGKEALTEMVRLRQNTPFERAVSPVTVEQRQMVLEWSIGD